MEKVAEATGYFAVIRRPSDVKGTTLAGPFVFVFYSNSGPFLVLG